MIIDRSPLAGISAYLRPADAAPDAVNLAAPGRVGRSPVLGPGDTLEVSGVALLLESDDLAPLLRHQDGPLLSVTLYKEMFPLLVDDPFAHRVHTIGGFEDFRRGVGTGVRALEVGGTPTLVSTGDGPTAWLSPVYPMPHPVRFAAAAWHLDASRAVPPEAFDYSLTLDLWAAGVSPTASPSRTVALASDRTPAEGRHTRFTLDEDAAAYRVGFTANVHHDGGLRERHGPDIPESIGRPLLQAVNLLEPSEPVHRYSSLHELLLACSERTLHDGPDGTLRRINAVLDLGATLTGPDRDDGIGESIELTVHSDAFTYVEARLEATRLVRPPRIS